MARRKAEPEEVESVDETLDEAPVEEVSEEVVEVEHLDPTKVIKLDDGANGYSVMDAPAGWQRDRRITLYGANYEHVDDDADGVWCYRQM
jgi:hypothetical protein